MKKIISFLSLIVYTSFSFSAEILQTTTGFYYPGNMKHSDSNYFEFDKNIPGVGCHLANDYNLSLGSPVYAVGSGTVAQLSTNINGYGSDVGAPGGAIVIRHTTADNKVFYGLYGHINNFKASVGDTVKGGQHIADVALYISGGVQLPHLHFGLNTSSARYDGYGNCTNSKGFVDPEPYLESNSPKIAAADTCKAIDDTASTTKNTIVTIASVLNNDTDSNGDTLTVSSADANSANGVTITNNNDGTFTYTPAIDFTGSDSFNYAITDNNGCTDTATVNVTINSKASSGSSGGGSFSVMGLISLLSLSLLHVFRRRKSI